MLQEHHRRDRLHALEVDLQVALGVGDKAAVSRIHTEIGKVRAGDLGLLKKTLAEATAGWQAEYGDLNSPMTQDKLNAYLASRKATQAKVDQKRGDDRSAARRAKARRRPPGA